MVSNSLTALIDQRRRRTKITSRLIFEFILTTNTSLKPWQRRHRLFFPQCGAFPMYFQVVPFDAIEKFFVVVLQINPQNFPFSSQFLLYFHHYLSMEV